MEAQHQAVPRPRQFRRPAPPPFLYDLEAASELSAASVLPEQFYSALTPTSKGGGQAALMRAVLEDALHCFQRGTVAGGRRAQRLAREAEEWFFTDDHHWLFSFVNICTVLGLDPEHMRLGLKRWRQHPPAGPQRKTPRALPRRQPLKLAA